MTTPEPLPPFGDATDEAISARLDGELAAFAADHGLTEPEVAAALDAWPGTPARADVLRRSRDATATPVEPLDDVTRRRLIAGARGAAASGTPARAPGRPAGSWWSLAAAAVVALLVVVAIGAMVLSDDGGGEQADSSARGGVEATAPEGDLGELGDVSDPARLRALLDGDLDAARREVPGARTAGGNGTADSAEDQASLAAPQAGPLRQAKEACAAQLAGSRPVRFVGTGVHQGRAVVVVGLSRGGRTIAFVVPADDCTTVLTSLSR